MRAFVLAALIAAPAPVLAEGAAYDAGMLAACLGRAGDDTARHGCIGKSSDACMAAPGGASTVGIGQCLGAETADWDALLNTSYTQAMARAKTFDAALNKGEGEITETAPLLKQAQRNWIAFRDASCTYQAARYQGGTMSGTTYASCVLGLTADQALRLRAIAEDGQ